MPGVLPFDPVAVEQATTVAIQMGQYAFDGVLAMTTAPERYDHPGACIPVAVSSDGPGEPVIRYVLVQRQHLAFQLGRYQSGLFASGPTDVFDAAAIVEKLVARCFDAVVG